MVVLSKRLIVFSYFYYLSLKSVLIPYKMVVVIPLAVYVKSFEWHCFDWSGNQYLTSFKGDVNKESHEGLER